jgi:putative cofactor-binding repeat protein
MKFAKKLTIAGVCLTSLLSVFSRVEAQGGVVYIDQARARNGRITPGDKPGFPVTITQPGYYQLTGNLRTTNPNRTLIEIQVGGVTINLAGFLLIGPALCAEDNSDSVRCTPEGSGVGITSFNIDTFESGTVILNGTVQGMPGGGVLLGSASHVEKVRVAHCGGDGISAESGSIVMNNRSVSNFNSGIAVFNSRVTGNVAIGNAGVGINAFDDSVVTGNVVRSNRGSGIVASDSTVADNTVIANGGNGIEGTGTFLRNTVNENRQSGFFVVISEVEHNEVRVNEKHGIEAGSSRVSGNIVAQNGEHGIVANECFLLENFALDNRGFGILFEHEESVYSFNVLLNNNGGNDMPQVSPGGEEMGENFCGDSTDCEPAPAGT